MSVGQRESVCQASSGVGGKHIGKRGSPFRQVAASAPSFVPLELSVSISPSPSPPLPSFGLLCCSLHNSRLADSIDKLSVCAEH